MTRDDLRTRILVHLYDDPLDPVFWTTPEIDAMIAEGQEIASEEVRAHRRTCYIPKRDGAQIYDLRTIATDCMAPYRLWDHTTSERLQARTMHALDQDRQRWLTTTGTQPRYWFPVSWGRFGIYPATLAGGGLLRVDYLAWPEAIQEDDDELDGSEADHDLLVLYGEYCGLIQQWEAARAAERFIMFSTQWKDARARNEIARWQARAPQRPRGRP